MNNNIDLIKNYYNVEEGIYKAYFDNKNLCYLFDSSIKYILGKDKSKLILKRTKLFGKSKHEIIKSSDQYYRDYNIEIICQKKYICNKTNNHECNCNCEEEHKYKEIYIKINNEDPFSIYNKNIISELESHSSYVITNFSNVFRYNNYISDHCTLEQID